MAEISGKTKIINWSKDHKNNHLYGYSKDCDQDYFVDCDDCFYMPDEYGCEDDLQNLNTGNKQNEDFTNVILGRESENFDPGALQN